jgi:hypothetical protein
MKERALEVSSESRNQEGKELFWNGEPVSFFLIWVTINF